MKLTSPFGISLISDFTRLIFDSKPVLFLPSILSVILEDAKWSRGDTGRPARAHKVTVRFTVDSENLSSIQDALHCYDVTVL